MSLNHTDVCILGGVVERYLRYAGLVRLDMIDPLDALRLLTPEVLILAVSILVFLICRALNLRRPDDDLLPVISSPTSDNPQQQLNQRRKYSMLTILGKRCLYWLLL